MQSQSSLDEISAVIRVKIDPCGTQKSFSVKVEAIKCPAHLLPIPAEQGKIPESLFAQFEKTFTADLAGRVDELVAQIEPDVREEKANKVEAELRKHAGKLEKVFWGGEVWNASADRWETWWKNLREHVENTKGLMMIELVLCSAMRQYIWESLFLLDEFFLPLQCAIVRRRYEDGEPLEPLSQSSGPCMVVLSNPHRDTGGPEDITPLENKVKPYIDHKKKQSAPAIVEVEATPNKGQLEVIQEKASEKPITSFLYVGHGHIDRRHCQLELEAEAGSLRGVKISTKQFREAFEAKLPPILILVACSLASNSHATDSDESGSPDRQPIDDLLDGSSIIMAMQFKFSVTAAEVFIEEFLGKEDWFSIQSIARGVAHGRSKLLISGKDKFSKIEAITPVIYSRVPVAVFEREKSTISRVREILEKFDRRQRFDYRDLIDCLESLGPDGHLLLTMPERHKIAAIIMSHLSIKLQVPLF